MLIPHRCEVNCQAQQLGSELELALPLSRLCQGALLAQRRHLFFNLLFDRVRGPRRAMQCTEPLF